MIIKIELNSQVAAKDVLSTSTLHTERVSKQKSYRKCQNTVHFFSFSTRCIRQTIFDKLWKRKINKKYETAYTPPIERKKNTKSTFFFFFFFIFILLFHSSDVLILETNMCSRVTISYLSLFVFASCVCVCVRVWCLCLCVCDESCEHLAIDEEQQEEEP